MSTSSYGTDEGYNGLHDVAMAIRLLAGSIVKAALIERGAFHPGLNEIVIPTIKEKTENATEKE